MQFPVTLEPFDRGDLFAGAVAHLCDARSGSLAVDDDRAGPAAAFAAAVLASAQAQVVPQDAQQAVR